MYITKFVDSLLFSKKLFYLKNVHSEMLCFFYTSAWLCQLVLPAFSENTPT